MANVLKIASGTIANFRALAAGSGLVPFQPYFITDLGLLALALTASTYATYAASPVGQVIAGAWDDVPACHLLCDGATPLRATYPELVASIAPLIGTCTISNATPAVITVANTLKANDRVSFENSGGALNTGLSVGTNYFVLATGLSGTAFRVSLTAGGAAINTTSAGSGTQSVRKTRWGCGNGTTTFTIPELRGEFPRYADAGRGINANRLVGEAEAESFLSHAHTISSVGNHAHGVDGYLSAGGAAAGLVRTSAGTSPVTFNSVAAGTHDHGAATGSQGGTETRPRNQALLPCIRFI